MLPVVGCIAFACILLHMLHSLHTGWIMKKTWNFDFSMKPLRDLQSNSPLLRLIMSIIGVRLADHLPTILLGRILLLSRACCKWPSSLDPIVLCWIWDTSPNFPAASCTYNDLKLNLHTAMLCLMKFRFEFWTEQLFTVGSFICWMHRGEKRAVHLVTGRKQTLSNNIQARNSHVHRMQPNVPVLWEGSKVHWNHWDPLHWLRLIFRSAP